MGKKTAIALAVAPVLCLAVGLITLFVYPIIYNKETAITRGSLVYDEWKEPDYPVYMKFHMFSYTNREEIMAGGTAKVKEVGVLSYRELQVKFDIKFIDGDKEVMYYNNKSYIFDEVYSTISENQIITVPNILLFTIWYTLPSTAFVLNGFYNNDEDPDLKNAASPFYEVEAGDFLWGYNENALLVALSPFVPGLPTTFGLQFNETNDGKYQIFTGKGDDNKNRAIVNKWNSETSLHYWGNNTRCNMINGTDGTIYPVDIDTEARLYIFNTQICRSIFLESEKEQKIEGVKTTKFVATKEVFDVHFEDNECYCHEDNQDLCLSGLLDVSQCYKEVIAEKVGQVLDISLIMSSPHFLYANQSLIDSIDGLSPNKSLHETYLNIESSSGVVLKAAKRIQANTNLQKKYNGFLTKLDCLKNVHNDWTYLVPLFWGEESLKEDQSLIDQVKQSDAITTGVQIASYCLIGVSILLVIISILCVVFLDKKNHKISDEGSPLIKKNISY